MMLFPLTSPAIWKTILYSVVKGVVNTARAFEDSLPCKQSREVTTVNKYLKLRVPTDLI